MKEKRFKNDSGDILIREISSGDGILEVLHLWDKNQAGCVIAYWKEVICDGEKTAQFESLYDRFVDVDFSIDISDFLKQGQKIADALLLLREMESKDKK